MCMHVYMHACMHAYILCMLCTHVIYDMLVIYVCMYTCMSYMYVMFVIYVCMSYMRVMYVICQITFSSMLEGVQLQSPWQASCFSPPPMAARLAVHMICIMRKRKYMQVWHSHGQHHVCAGLTSWQSTLCAEVPCSRPQWLA